MAATLSRVQELSADVDLRMVDLFVQASGVETWDFETVCAYMRSSFAKGYYEALAEPVAGALCRDHGYRVPTRRAV